MGDNDDEDDDDDDDQYGTSPLLSLLHLPSGPASTSVDVVEEGRDPDLSIMNDAQLQVHSWPHTYATVSCLLLTPPSLVISVLLAYLQPHYSWLLRRATSMNLSHCELHGKQKGASKAA